MPPNQPINSTPTPAPLPPSMPPPPTASKREGLKGVVSTLLLLLIAPIIALFLTAFVFQSYEVDGPSMEATLQNRDRLFVLKVPKTWARITGKTYIPSRGDIVVFTRNTQTGTFGEKQLIKRIIAIPGERVVVKNGTLTVFNAEHPEGFEPDKALDYGKTISNTPGSVDVTVGEGEVFVCGDNRINSLDSRNFGPIAADDIVGKLGVRIFPLDKIEVF